MQELLDKLTGETSDPWVHEKVMLLKNCKDLLEQDEISHEDYAVLLEDIKRVDDVIDGATDIQARNQLIKIVDGLLKLV